MEKIAEEEEPQSEMVVLCKVVDGNMNRDFRFLWIFCIIITYCICLVCLAIAACLPV